MAHFLEKTLLYLNSTEMYFSVLQQNPIWQKCFKLSQALCKAKVKVRKNIFAHDQCVQILRIFATFAHRKGFWPFLDGLFSIRHSFERTSANLVFHLANLRLGKHGEFLKNNLAIWSHCRATMNKFKS